MEGYDTAQVCRNGHAVNSMAASSPQYNESFCGECGAATLTACEGCGSPIRGYYHSDVVVIGSRFKPSAYCYQCGRPYPWTEGAISAARELADEIDGLTPDERETLKGTLDDLVRDSARTQVAALRFKKLAAKVGKEGAGLLKSVLYGVASDAARKAIWGA